MTNEKIPTPDEVQALIRAPMLKTIIDTLKAGQCSVPISGRDQWVVPSLKDDLAAAGWDFEVKLTPQNGAHKEVTIELKPRLPKSKPPV